MIYSAKHAEIKNPTSAEIESLLLEDFLVHAFAPRKHQVAIVFIPKEHLIRVYFNAIGQKDFERSNEKNETKKAIEYFLELAKQHNLL